MQQLKNSNLTRTHALDESGPDFWSLSVQSDGHWSVVNRSRPKTLGCITDILDGLSMVLYDVGWHNKHGKCITLL